MDLGPDRWRVLALVDLRPELGRMADVPASCQACPHPDACDTAPRWPQLWGTTWDRCPRGAVRDDAHYQAASRLWAASQVSPLSGWPYSYAAWVVDAVLAIEVAHREAEAAAMAPRQPVTNRNGLAQMR